jgi:hypothetical protein
VSLEHFERLHAAVAKEASKGGGQGMGTVPRQYHTDAALRGAFETFGTETKGRGKTVSIKKFLKLAQECGLVDNSRVTSQSCALIFARARTRGHRTMDYEDFLRALAMLAADKQIMFEKLAWQVLDSVNSMMGYTSRTKRRSLGPVEEVIDEDAAGRTPRESFKETATPPRGSPPRRSGGSSEGASHHRRASSLGTVDLEEAEGTGAEGAAATTEPVDVSSGAHNIAFESYDAEGTGGTLDAEELLFVLADMGALRGVDPKLAAVAVEHTFQELAGAEGSGREVTPGDVNHFVYALDRIKRNQPASAAAASPQPPPAEELFESVRVQELFRAAAAFEDTDGVRMDSVAFAKLVDRCGLTSPAFTLQAADVCFAAAKARGQRTVSMREWVAALGSMAAELGVPVERMVADMVARKPHAAATVAATATQQRFNLSTARRRGVSAVLGDDEPVSIEELLLSLADVGLFEGSTCQVSLEDAARSKLEPGVRSTYGGLARLNVV